MTKTVKFTRHWPPYYSGDRAGFKAGQAAWLVEQGLAAYVAKEDKEAAEAQLVDVAGDGPTDAGTRTRTVAEVVLMVAEIGDREALLALRRGEVGDPHQPGGRKGVLGAIDIRLAALVEAEEEDAAAAVEPAAEGG